MMTKMIANLYYDDDHQLALDLYPPAGAAQAGVILMADAWQPGDKHQVATWARRLNQRGFFVIAPSLRPSYPAVQVDLARLWQWLQHRDLPFNRRKLAVAGAGLGGTLAVEMSLQFGIPGISLSGALDIAEWLAEHPHASTRYRRLLGDYLPALTLAEAATPTTRVSATSGPLFLANSLHELVPASGVAKMSAALSQAEVPHTTHLLAGDRHGEAYHADIEAASLAFLKHYLHLHK